MKSASDTAESAVRDLESAASKADSAIKKEFQSFVADLENLISSTTSLTGDELSKARDKLGERVAAAKDSLQTMSSDVVSRARDTAKATDEYVHEQPWKSMGVSAGVGFLLGMLVARR